MPKMLYPKIAPYPQEIEKAMEKYRNPTWKLYKCDKGNRWSCVKGGVADDIEDNSPCHFSGCKQDHNVHFVGETKDPDDPHDWFLNVNP